MRPPDGVVEKYVADGNGAGGGVCVGAVDGREQSVTAGCSKRRGIHGATGNDGHGAAEAPAG